MKKRGMYLAILMIALFLLLVSCKPRAAAGDRPLETAAALRMVQTGTQGVEIRTLQNAPPSTVYDQNELVALVEISNKGNHDLEAFDCFVQVVGFDPDIFGIGFQRVASCAENIGVLEGKNVYNVEGSTNQIEFRSPNVALPEGVFEYNPTLNFMACYNYHTIANPEVCVDPLFYQVTSEQKTCIPTDVGTGGGQGAPVGIGYVGVDMVGGRAIFEINVRNFNSAGRVLSPYTDPAGCGQDIDYTDLDRVEYEVRLSGSSLVDCRPRDGFVRLTNGQGKIVCTFDIPGANAYKTPLLIDLDYNYIQSFTKNIKIIQTPQ